MSSYLATIEDRGTVPGMSLGPMIGALQGLEDSLTNLEKILTTPLPFVYSAHIRHTVWLYLFFLPFQICETFGCKLEPTKDRHSPLTRFLDYAIPGIAVASFLYLGFMAAGEEIEQPFGYGGHICSCCVRHSLTVTPDNNDLDLDFFCRQIIHLDLQDIRQVSCPNSDLGIPGVVKKGSLVGYGVVVDAGLSPQATPGEATPPKRRTDQFFSDPNATLVGRQQGTSTQDIMILSAATSLPGAH